MKVCLLVLSLGFFNCFLIALGFFESHNLMEWHKSKILDGMKSAIPFSPEIYFYVGNIKPVVRDVIHFMKENGIEKIALMGIAW